jgi:hypothetical protein
LRNCIQTVLVELLEVLGISNAFVGKLQAGAVRQSHASSVLKEDVKRGSIEESHRGESMFVSKG